jgi:hypothetical protein
MATGREIGNSKKSPMTAGAFKAAVNSHYDPLHGDINGDGDTDWDDYDLFVEWLTGHNGAGGTRQVYAWDAENRRALRLARRCALTSSGVRPDVNSCHADAAARRGPALWGPG